MDETVSGKVEIKNLYSVRVRLHSALLSHLGKDEQDG